MQTWELLTDNATDLCLMCHKYGAYAVFGDDPLFPPTELGAGNFVFLLEDNLNDATGGAFDQIQGYAAGHSIVAPGYGLDADPRFGVAPGGSYYSADLGCTSCHDPHGNTNFRMLWGEGPIMGGAGSFTRPAPLAEGIDPGTGGETRSNHTAYLRGMSEWCGNCHGNNYHSPGSGSGFQHPKGQGLPADYRNQYNQYDGDDNPIGGSPATAYIVPVPFEDDANTVDSTSGPGGGSQVMCLTCHRAHASSAPGAGRWDFNVGLLWEDGKESMSYPIPDPYRSQSQGTLCRKCHEVFPPDSTESPQPFGWP